MESLSKHIILSFQVVGFVYQYRTGDTHATWVSCYHLDHLCCVVVDDDDDDVIVVAANVVVVVVDDDVIGFPSISTVWFQSVLALVSSSWYECSVHHFL